MSEALLDHYRSDVKYLVAEYLTKSKSQLGQDIFALCESAGKRNGFFVEFGAGDGEYLSNSFLLEREFGWTGILAEPNRWLFEHLSNNRPNAIIESSCVWTQTGEELEFNAVTDAYFSTVHSFTDSDNHSETRASGQKYSVKTISLFDLLQKHKAPPVIDFLSIDTEGSEFEILNSFDFAKYQFKVIACEHNFTSNRDRIFQLLTRNGYRRVHEIFSKHDDWYVLQ
jgi:FkbM family methyltransferase